MLKNSHSRMTKIVCTMGPASNSPEMIRSMIRAGMDVARLNFSHGDHGGHGAVLDEIRKASEEYGRPVGVLADLAGPKIRLGELAAPERRLSYGEEVVLVAGSKAQGEELPVNYPYLYEDVKEGARILLADGRVELLATEKNNDKIVCHVVVGGVLTSHKGVNTAVQRSAYSRLYG